MLYSVPENIPTLHVAALNSVSPVHTYLRPSVFTAARAMHCIHHVDFTGRIRKFPNGPNSIAFGFRPEAQEAPESTTSLRYMQIPYSEGMHTIPFFLANTRSRLTSLIPSSVIEIGPVDTVPVSLGMVQIFNDYH
jgi:hypothetical protein